MSQSAALKKPVATRSGTLGLAIVASLVVAIFAWTAGTSVAGWGQPAAAQDYNLLVAGFQAGRLSLDQPVPAGLARLADPYDPAANLPYRVAPFGLHDLSYFRDRLYLYFGVTPALLLFWPWAALTREDLPQKAAVAFFCAAGFLTSVALLCAVWRRHFSGVPGWLVAALAAGLGLATGIPILLQRPDICEVPISCAYALTVLALAGIWRALVRPQQALRWVAAASFCFGLAVGARPSELPGAVLLLIPGWSAWSNARRPKASAAPGARLLHLLAAGLVPLALCGLGLLAYNYLRFQNPLEFGQHYQLAADRQDTARHFSLAYLAFNFRVYFVAPASWSLHFPFVGPMAPPPLPAGHAVPEDPFGILADIPFAALALAAPLAWRGRPEDESRILRDFAAAAAILFAGAALVLGLFYGSCSRYEAEFLPPLILLAVVGALGLERLPGAQRRAARIGWLLLLGFSIAFNLLQGVQRRSIERYTLGNTLTDLGRLPEAIAQYEAALRAQPNFGEAHNNLGNAFFRLGQLSPAIEHYEAALRLEPDTAALHYNLGVALTQTGSLAEAAAHYRAAILLRPDFAAAHLNLAAVLYRLGRSAEAAAELRTANALAAPAGESRK